jgi:hypothetical protein
MRNGLETIADAGARIHLGRAFEIAFVVIHEQSGGLERLFGMLLHLVEHMRAADGVSRAAAKRAPERLPLCQS